MGQRGIAVELVDDTDMITFVFFGSRGVAGVHAGPRLVAAGTIGTHRGERVIRSPQLWLEAARHESDDTTWSNLDAELTTSP